MQHSSCWAQWLLLVILAFRRLQLEDCCRFNYRARTFLQISKPNNKKSVLHNTVFCSLGCIIFPECRIRTQLQKFWKYFYPEITTPNSFKIYLYLCILGGGGQRKRETEREHPEAIRGHQIHYSWISKLLWFAQHDPGNLILFPCKRSPNYTISPAPPPKISFLLLP